MKDDPAGVLLAEESQLLTLAEDLERRGRLLPGMTHSLVALMRRLAGHMLLEGVSRAEMETWLGERGREITQDFLADAYLSESDAGEKLQ